jgi:hypothetical protein
MLSRLAAFAGRPAVPTGARLPDPQGRRLAASGVVLPRPGDDRLAGYFRIFTIAVGPPSA